MPGPDGKALAWLHRSATSSISSTFTAGARSESAVELGCGCLLGNFAGEIAQSSELCRTTARATVDEWRVGFAECLCRGQDYGSVRSDLSAEALADFFWNAWEGSLLRTKLQDSIER